MEKTTEVNFKRKGRIGFQPISVDNKQTVYVELVSAKIELFEKRDGETIPFVEVINMKTGEENRLWLSGQLNYQLTVLQKARPTLTGLKLEITHLGKTETEIDGEPAMVNNYSMFELE